MKVYDIIAENKELHEGGGKTGAVASLATAAWKPVSNFVGKIFNSERSQLVKAIADSLGSSKWAGEATSKHAAQAAKGLGSKAVSMVKADKGILDDAAKMANKSRGLSTFGKVGDKVGSVASGVGKVGSWGFTATKWGIRAYTALNIYELFENYNKTIDAWDKKLQAQVAAGKMSEDEYKQSMAYIRQSEMGILIPKVAAGILASAMTTATLGSVGLLFSKADSAIIKGIGAGIAGLGTVGNAYVWSKINSPEGADAFAKVLVGNALGEWAVKQMGTAGTNAINWLKGTTDQAKAADAGQKSDANGKQDAGGAGSTTPVQQPAKTTAGGQTLDTGTGTQVIKDPNKDKLDTGGTNSVTAGTTSGKLYTPVGYKRDAQGNLVLDDD